jgi:hypothetical protein
VRVVSELFGDVESALAEAQERLAGLASARANHDAATTALNEAAAALTTVAARMVDLVEGQHSLQVQLEEQARKYIEANSHGLDLSVLARLEARLDALGSADAGSSAEVLARLESLEAAVNASHEAAVTTAKKANAHVTAKAGAVLESVQSYGDQIYELTAELYNGLIVSDDSETAEDRTEDSPAKRGRLFSRGGKH